MDQEGTDTWDQRPRFQSLLLALLQEISLGLSSLL
jgi:hypothetical protein